MQRSDAKGQKATLLRFDVCSPGDIVGLATAELFISPGSRTAHSANLLGRGRLWGAGRPLGHQDIGPRLSADVNGDHAAAIVAFGQDPGHVALSHPFLVD